MSVTSPTVLIIPGLRDHVNNHWQTLLAAQLPKVHSVPPMGREDLDFNQRVRAIDAAIAAIEGPVLFVAHSGGCLMVAHWAQTSVHTHRVSSALLATPPDFEHPMPQGYPSLNALQASGWLPVPRLVLPFHSLVAISDNDPLATRGSVQALARDWGSETIDLGSVGHLNPSSGYGEWPMAILLIEQLLTMSDQVKT